MTRWKEALFGGSVIFTISHGALAQTPPPVPPTGRAAPPATLSGRAGSARAAAGGDGRRPDQPAKRPSRARSRSARSFSRRTGDSRDVVSFRQQRADVVLGRIR